MPLGGADRTFFVGGAKEERGGGGSLNKNWACLKRPAYPRRGRAVDAPPCVRLLSHGSGARPWPRLRLPLVNRSPRASRGGGKILHAGDSWRVHAPMLRLLPIWKLPHGSREPLHLFTRRPPCHTQTTSDRSRMPCTKAANMAAVPSQLHQAAVAGIVRARQHGRSSRRTRLVHSQRPRVQRAGSQQPGSLPCRPCPQSSSCLLALAHQGMLHLVRMSQASPRHHPRWRRLHGPRSCLRLSLQVSPLLAVVVLGHPSLSPTTVHRLVLLLIICKH
jgi:hypothetical protein